ncbi:ImcF-related family protein [Pseudomonas sp. NPDC008258]|uniref:ImcF-related family protein n=1 Tax=Pseudomonas sp. NPDC008258 TaxID=3364418 RepID=UPI0036F172B2
MKKQRSVWLAVLCLAVVGGILIWVQNPIVSISNEHDQFKWTAGLLAACMLILLLDSLGALTIRRLATLDFNARLTKPLVQWLAAPLASEPDADDVEAVLRSHYGYFWRRKVRVLLVVGEPECVEAVAPGLVEQRWLEGGGALLVHGPNPGAGEEAALPDNVQALLSRRGLDGVIWAVTRASIANNTVMDTGAHRLRKLARSLRWHMPVHLWQVCQSAWPQDSSVMPSTGCVFAQGVTPQQFHTSLDQLVEQARRLGLEQMAGVFDQDFLLRLSLDLKVACTGFWQPALAALARGSEANLRGLWFSLPIANNTATADHHWVPARMWQAVLGDETLRPRRLGWAAGRAAYVVTLSFAALWCAGLLLSFITNRAETQRIDQALAALQQPHEGTDPLATLRDLSLDISRLDYRAEHGAPWYYRFGLDRTRALRDAAWPHYVQAVQQQVRDPAAASLQAQLSALVKLPPGSAERAQRTQQAYTQLKAYLMLARPEKSDADFLVQTLGKNEPGLWSFYAERLPANPGWAIAADARLIAQVRQILLTQLGQRNAETSLYQQALDTATNHYPALALQHMVGDTDASPLFATTASVPGAFTRQAWEGQVREAIETAAKARREEIDWVLSDNPSDITRALSPEQLRERLTARYFNDYGKAWLAFLNSLRWRKGATLDEAISQLTLMSDNRQSPLIALMNTLAYQGQAGIRGQALADTLIQSAQNLIGQDRTAVSGQPLATDGGPLDGTFGPLLGLLGKRANGQPGDSSLSLQAFLTQVTSVRLKLQQIADAPDPQAMTQALAQSVFQGKRVDLVETRSYGSLIAASLGAEWGRAAQTLFVQPLDQAWQRVLQPSAAGLNRDWQRAIVDDWDNAFAGRYPFAVTSSDASLPMLGKLIRADTGRIERFLHQQLNGLLRKEGRRWVAEPRNSQGLRFNPAFLSAVNQLGELADVLFTEGGMAVNFELRGKPVRDVVQTTFILNGEKHHYYNQRERWQRFTWPGQSNGPGVSLTWTSVFDGERLFAYNQGTWGLIRLLEQAQLTPMDAADSQYKLQLKAPDGLNLTWDLRTEFGAGPLALLKLRDFTLPQQVFLLEGDQPQRYAQNEGTP